MVYPEAPIDHSEFGGGPGLIDAELRKNRILESDQELIEIYATNPADPASDPTTSDIYYGLSGEGE